MARLLSADFHMGRILALTQAAEDIQTDGLLILNAANVYYASGYLPIPSERPIGLFVGAKGTTLYIPMLEQENVALADIESVGLRDVRVYFEYPGETHPIQWMVNDLANRLGVKRLGVDHLELGVYNRLQTPIEIITTDAFEHLRWVKTPEEISLVERAAGYADFCLETLLNVAPGMIRDGATELDLLRACLGATSARLKQEIGEEFILGGSTVVGTVHSGPQAALPHGSPGTRQPQIGDTLISGIGVSVAGYHAESGATFVVGEPKNDTMRCLEAAAACNDAGVNALRSGATCASVNEAALSALRDYGYGDFIRHRLGHGMGINGHESPWLAPGDATILQPNMAFSNEPGIYRPGIDGYRTINTMIVTDGAARVPSRFLAEHPAETRILVL